MKPFQRFISKIWSFLSSFDFVLLYGKKLKENDKVKRLNNTAIIILFVDVLFKAFNLSRFVESEYWLSRSFEPMFVFIDHFWLEIFSGIIIYIILEDKIRKIDEVPQRTGSIDHEELMKVMLEKATKKIRIIDTSIYPFFKNSNTFEDHLKPALNDRKNLKVEILLLHPDTYAAEQRSKDLSLTTKNYLKEMKHGLAELNTFITNLSPTQAAKVTVRLFKTTPTMIYTSWDGNANFGLLHPNQVGDIKDTFNIRKEGDLPHSFEKYFEDLWDSYEKNSPAKVVDMNDYLFLGISDQNSIVVQVPNLNWGGNDESRELPRYFTERGSSKHFKLLKNLAGQLVKIYHDNTILLGHIQRISDTNDDNKHNYAELQIKKTYGDQIGDFGTALFQISYLYENQITFSYKNLIKEKLEENGYVFVSHKHYEISRFLLEHYDALVKCYNNLVEDQYDREAIEKVIKKKNPSYKANPRERLLAVYECNINKGEISIKETQTHKYPYLFRFEYYNEEIHVEPNRAYTTLFDLSKTPGNEQYLDNTQLFIHSMIQADLINILGQTDYINHTKQFNVYVNLMRAYVTKESPIAYPTLQTARQTECDYRIVHLIKRESITGGTNNIVIKADGQYEQPPGDSIMLDNPLDAVFFRKEIRKKIKNDIQIFKIEHAADPIYYSPDIGANNNIKIGCRDILVIEFEEK